MLDEDQVSFTRNSCVGAEMDRKVRCGIWIFQNIFFLPANIMRNNYKL